MNTKGPAIVIIGGLVAALCGFVWLVLLRYFAGFFVWLAIFVLFLALSITSLYCFVKAGIIKIAEVAALTATVDTTVNISSALATSYDGLGASAEEEQTQFFTYAAYLSAMITLVYLTIILLMRKNIKIAVAVIKEASKAVAHMPLIVGFPITTLVAVISMFGFWVWTFGNCYTMGEIVAADLTSTASNVVSTGDNYTSSIQDYATSPIRDYVLWYLIFALFWMNNFIQGIAQMTICGSFAAWYWTETDKDTGTKGNMYKDKFPVIASLWRTIRYHLGTVALGSLIIAICQFLRVVLGYLDEKSKKAQQKNICVKIIFKCLGCFLACFEKCVKYITRKAYIVTAIKGSNFCSSGMTVFHLLMSHGGLIGITNVIASAVIIMGKCLIITVCTIIGYWVFTTFPDFLTGGALHLQQVVFPTLLVALLSWMIADGFLQVYDMGIDTILISFLFDLKENKEGQYMFSESLAKAAGKGGQTRSQVAVETDNKNETETSAKYVTAESEDGEEVDGIFKKQSSAGELI
jgi:choline transporter-like protein 2/4/5